VEEYPQQQDQPHDSSSTTTPSERSTSSTASGQSVKQQQPASETSPLLPKDLHNNNTPVVIIRHDQQQDPSHVTPTSFPHSSIRKLGIAIKQLALRFNSFMTPPLYAAVLALIVGLTPLKQILYDKQSFLYPSFTKAIEMCGKAAVPIVLSCLGAQLASISASQHHTPGIQKPVTAAVVIRMLMAPLVVVPLVVLFVKVGSAYSILATDPVFSVMLIVLGCTPTAINLIQISQVNAIFEEEMLHVLFWSYGVVCVPVVTLIVFLALNVVDRLL
jgi:predicted permease